MEENRNTWFVLFGAGAERNDVYGWMALDKEEYTKTEARKAGDRAAIRKGEANFCYYFCKQTTYVTDSITAFQKRCEKVGMHPNLEEYL